MLKWCITFTAVAVCYNVRLENMTYIDSNSEDELKTVKFVRHIPPVKKNDKPTRQCE
jgi:hypothetical protein